MFGAAGQDSIRHRRAAQQEHDTTVRAALGFRLSDASVHRRSSWNEKMHLWVLNEGKTFLQTYVWENNDVCVCRPIITRVCRCLCYVAASAYLWAPLFFDPPPSFF